MRPLEGIRVTDFTNHAAGPYSTLMLSLLGAEIVRIESRTRLDIQRRPHPVYGRFNVPNFDYLAGGKKSVTLNLKTNQANRLAKELIASSDVVVENFRPGVMDRLGLGWPVVHEVNPAAVMLSLSAYGQLGPESGRPGYAPIFAAEGGLGYLTGYSDGPPAEIRNAMDHQSGMVAAFVVVSLLEERERSGVGSYADLAAREVAAMLVGESILQALEHGASTRVGNEHETWCPHGLYAAAGPDRWVAIAVRSDEEWQRLVALLGSPGWCTSALDSVEGRRQQRELIDERLAEWMAFQLAEDLVHLLQAHGLCAELSTTAQDLLTDEHLRDRGMVTSLEHPEYGKRVTVGAPWRFADNSVVYNSWSPDLGQHNEEVFCGLLGHSSAQLSQWIEEGVVH